MKTLKKNKILAVSLIFGIVVALFVCLFGVVNFKNGVAFADSETSNLSETDNLKFVLNSKGDGYVVSKANNYIVEAVIPETYNNLPVTEVATSGFSGCTKLEYVRIPNSVYKIGANAFANCKSLQKLTGMVFVSEIGNNAFAMCSQVKNLTIPPRVEKLGSNIIRNVSNDVYARNTEAKLMSLNASWNANSTATIIYGNDLMCSEIYENGELIGFSIDEWQTISSPDESFELICSYEYEGKYYPILEIADSAFIFCEFKSLTLKYDEENISTDYVINVNSNAFYSVNAQYIDVEVDINLEENTESVFAFSTISSITLPYSLDKITSYMFQECVNLSEIKSANSSLAINHLSSNVTYIGNNAFESCAALAELYIPSSLEYIGGYAFTNWGKDSTQTIHLDVYGPDDAWDSNWNSDISSGAKIEFKKALVMFAKDGGKGGSDSVEVSFGQAMPDASHPTKNRFKFNGYYSEPNGGGTQYYDKNMNSVTDWDIKAPAILYAYWEADIDVRIDFDSCGGIGGTGSLTARLNEEMPSAKAPQCVGYTFQGYFQYPEGYGTMYYNAAMESAHEWDQDVETGTIYAHWVANKYTVILSDDVSIEVTYGEPMPAVDMEIPTLKGHTFMGYFSEENGEGKQYYSQDMYSVSNWDITSNNVRLYPYNKADLIQITIILREGATPFKVTATYGQPMPELPSSLDTYKYGYTFLGIGVYGNQSDPYYTNELQSIKNCDFSETTTLYGFWEGTQYTITVDNTGGEGIESFKIRFNDLVPDLPEPTKVGYTFDHHYTEPNGKGTQIPKNSYTYFNWWAIVGDITIYANWIGNEYIITLDSQGATNYSTTTIKQVYGDIVYGYRAYMPNRPGYNFRGYFTEPNGKGLFYIDQNMNGYLLWDIPKDTTLYAYWTPSSYTVVLNQMGGINGTSYVNVYYNAEMPNAYAPTRDGYIFQGYYTSPNGKGTQYYTATMTSARNWDKTDTKILYAYWVPATSATAVVIDYEVQELTILSTECLAASNTNEEK